MAVDLVNSDYHKTRLTTKHIKTLYLMKSMLIVCLKNDVKIVQPNVTADSAMLHLRMEKFSRPKMSEMPS